MEVLVKVSQQQRISRALVAGVGITLTLGVVFWAYNLGKTRGAADQSHRRDSRNAPAIEGGLVTAKSPDTALALSKAPTTAPAPGAVMETPTTAPSAAPLLAAVESAKPAPNHGAAMLASSVSAAKPLDIKTNLPSVADAKTIMSAGKLLDARRELSAALTSGALSEADVKATKQLLSQINATVIFSTERFPEDEYGGVFTVPPGGALAKIAKTNEISPDLLMQVNDIKDARRLQANQQIKLIKGPFNAIVYKSAFTLEIWLGNPGEKGALYITSYPVGLGKDDSTPSGVWAVGNTLKNPAYYSPRGGGVIAADDPKNPLGKFWIALIGTDGKAVGKTSYGIHGTIDPNSIGKQESMGCIRLRNDDITMVYELLVTGKSIVVVKD